MNQAMLEMEAILRHGTRCAAVKQQRNTRKIAPTFDDLAGIPAWKGGLAIIRFGGAMICECSQINTRIYVFFGIWIKTILLKCGCK